MKKNRSYIFCLILFNLIGIVKLFSLSPPLLLTSAPLNCQYYEGLIDFDYIRQNDTLLYTTNYLLTDTNNIILQIKTESFFTNILEGDYLVYVLEYKNSGNIQGNITGNQISDIQSPCYDLSNGIPVTVCVKPDAIKTVSGKFFHDFNEDGLDNDGASNLNGIVINIYEDNNQDGMVDLTDSLLSSEITDATGQYSFTFDESVLGRLITHIVISSDSSTIPVDRYYTTDNIEIAVFSTESGIDSTNNFGISQHIDLENEVWLDLNANGIQEPIEVNIPNMQICITNLSPLLIDGFIYPPNGYMDTVITDSNGIFIFEDLPDADWQIIAHNDTTQYIATYDADGGILNTTNFTLTDGAVIPINNAWCLKEDCLTDLDFGFRLAGDLSISGNVCLDDNSKDGVCNTGDEEQLDSMVLSIFTETGKKLGGIMTNQNGSYLFPHLFKENYIIDLSKTQNALEDFFFTTKLGNTPASKITNANYSIFQKVTVDKDIYGVDFAFIPHVTTTAKNDMYTLCPGMNYENQVANNDSISSDLAIFQLLKNPEHGKVEMNANGAFKYAPSSFDCGTDQFTYEVCNLLFGDCDTALVTLIFNDDTPPTLLNVPSNISINCDEELPVPGLVSAFDNCPRIAINIEESSTIGEDGCSQYDYSLTRTWTATDLCGNTKSESQFIEVKDVEPPGIFRIYTLPNGKKLIAGTADLTSNRWKTVNFPIDFDASPLVINQITSVNETTSAITQTRKVSKSQFEIRIREEEGNDNIHSQESVAWIALEKGFQKEPYAFFADVIDIDDKRREIGFDDLFTSIPMLFSSLQTTNEQDPVTIAYTELTNTGSLLQLQEETSYDAETIHSKEQVAYLGIERLGDLFNKTGDIIGETGRVNIKNGWNELTLNHNYYNPIIIASTQNNVVDVSSIINIKEVAANSFKLKVQGWDYSNFFPETSTIAYMVIEGSIPLYDSNFCKTGISEVEIGKDLIAVDNCDNSVELAYSEQRQFNGIQQEINRTWKSSDECGNEVSYTQKVSCEGIAVKIKTFLQGALIDSKEAGLMRDDLRRKELLPIKEPYSTLPNFKHVGSGGGEILNEELLSIIGPNAIVDWVLLEIRNSKDIGEVIATSAGLIQRDGDIISATGDSLIVFENVAYGDYFITVRHRNHIGLTSKETYTFGLNNIPEIDFRNVFTEVNGTVPTIKLDGVNAQWAGDLNGDGKIIYQGPNNDPFQMFLQIILDDKNTHYLTNYISRTYSVRDFNMDGIVIFQGPNNDRSKFLYNTILSHPNNKNFFANYVISVTLDKKNGE